MTRHEQEQAIAHDLDICELGMANSKGKLRAQYARQFISCMDQIREWNKEDGLGQADLDELFAKLSG